MAIQVCPTRREILHIFFYSNTLHQLDSLVSERGDACKVLLGMLSQTLNDWSTNSKIWYKIPAKNRQRIIIPTKRLKSVKYLERFYFLGKDIWWAFISGYPDSIHINGKKLLVWANCETYPSYRWTKRSYEWHLQKSSK